MELIFLNKRRLTVLFVSTSKTFADAVLGYEDQMKPDIATVIANLQREIQAIRDLALIAPTLQKASMLQTANLIEASIREYDKQAI